MTLAAFAYDLSPGDEPDLHAVARVTVATEETSWQAEVSYWPSLLDQWGVEGVHAYVEAEALAGAGFLADAHDHLAVALPGAAWCDRWRAEHPLA